MFLPCKNSPVNVCEFFVSFRLKGTQTLNMVQSMAFQLVTKDIGHLVKGSKNVAQLFRAYSGYISVMVSHKLMGIYMGVLILGVIL